jgi:hypothetical protein
VSISQVIAAVAALIAAAALVWCWALSRRLAAALNRSSELQQLAAEGDLAGLAERVDARLKGLEVADENRQADDAALAERLATAVRHVGLVRFDAFSNTAGEQSFSLALLDDEGEGLVVTSIYGRGEYRLYAKPLRDGTSTYSLTEEEHAAIERATAGETGRTGR